MDKAESLLKDIGMKEYEAKAFMVIVQCGVCSADQVSKMSGIPLTRVYETMHSLQRNGLVTVLNTRPKKYRLVSLDALSNIIESRRVEMEREFEKHRATVEELKGIIPRASKGDSEEVREGFWIFKGREATVRRIADEKRKARKEILYFSDDFSWFPKSRRMLEEKIGEGVSLKVLMNLNGKTRETVTDLLSIGADVRGWDVRNLKGSIVDGRVVHLVSKIPRAGVVEEDHYGNPGSDELFMYDCLTTENPIIVNMVKTYFDVFWWRGEKPSTAAFKAMGEAQFREGP